MNKGAPTHYLNLANYAVGVKTASFFIEQGGLKSDWGKSWVPVVANSIGEARRIGVQMKKDRGEDVLEVEYNPYYLGEA